MSIIIKLFMLIAITSYVSDGAFKMPFFCLPEDFCEEHMKYAVANKSVAVKVVKGDLKLYGPEAFKKHLLESGMARSSAETFANYYESILAQSDRAKAKNLKSENRFVLNGESGAGKTYFHDMLSGFIQHMEEKYPNTVSPIYLMYTNINRHLKSGVFSIALPDDVTEGLSLEIKKARQEHPDKHIICIIDEVDKALIAALYLDKPKGFPHIYTFNFDMNAFLTWIEQVIPGLSIVLAGTMYHFFNACAKQQDYNNEDITAAQFQSLYDGGTVNFNGYNMRWPAYQTYISKDMPAVQQFINRLSIRGLPKMTFMNYVCGCSYDEVGKFFAKIYKMSSQLTKDEDAKKALAAHIVVRELVLNFDVNAEVQNYRAMSRLYSNFDNKYYSEILPILMEEIETLFRRDISSGLMGEYQRLKNIWLYIAYEYDPANEEKVLKLIQDFAIRAQGGDLRKIEEGFRAVATSEAKKFAQDNGTIDLSRYGLMPEMTLEAPRTAHYRRLHSEEIDE
jgi:energy-coupling factor transporter ATP-binding protein EcfA2